MKTIEIDSCKDRYAHILHVGDPILYIEQYSKSSTPLICKSTILNMYIMQKREYVKCNNGWCTLVKYVILDFEELYKGHRLELT